jgi:exodeoxyribonuclease VII large subunit
MDAPISVKRFLEQVKVHLEPSFASVCLVGEVSNARAGGRHLYFSLKEDGATLSCAVWASQRKNLGFEPKDGDRVTVRGSLDLFVQGGSLTLAVTHCDPAGVGGLSQRLRGIEAMLRLEGVFDGPKRVPPRTPKKIAVIAALGGAALQDILNVTQKRAPGTDILVFPAAAQGESCVADNLMALQEAQDEYWACDVVLMARGGGSMEDLWGYNDPDLVRAVSKCRLPIVTGVGHEIDVTLVDLAADRRAATPSQAAELATTARDTLEAELKGTMERLDAKMDACLRRLETALNLLTDKGLMRLDPVAPLLARLDAMATRMKLAAPQSRLERAEPRLAMLRHRMDPLGGQIVEARETRLKDGIRRMNSAAGKTLDRRRQGLELALARLGALDPRAPLERGFVLVKDQDGRHLKSSSEAKTNARLRLHWGDGERAATVD